MIAQTSIPHPCHGQLAKEYLSAAQSRLCKSCVFGAGRNISVASITFRQVGFGGEFERDHAGLSGSDRQHVHCVPTSPIAIRALARTYTEDLHVVEGVDF